MPNQSPDRTDEEPCRRPWNHPATTLWTVAIIAAIVHMWAFGGTALIITNDSIDYLSSAWPIFGDQAIEISRFRTPGYPAFLALCFNIFGANAWGVLFVQHVLGALVPVMITRIALAFSTPALALLAGVLCAIEPSFVMYCSVMLTESLSTFLFVLAAMIVVGLRSRPLLSAVALGAVLAISVMVRPAFQVTVPFMILAAVGVAGLSMWRRAGVAALVLATFLVTALPWLSFNRERSVRGFAQGSSAAFWISLVQQNLLIKDYPLPPDVERRFAPVRATVGGSPQMWAFVGTPADSSEQMLHMQKITGRWAMESVRQRPFEYIERLPFSFLWQLNYYPQGGFIQQSQVAWFSWAISCDSSAFGTKPINFHFDGTNEFAPPLAMHGQGGLLRRFYGWWALYHPGGYPQIPFMFVAFLTGLWAVATGRLSLAMILLASAAIIGVHVMMLFHQSRYSLPAHVFWFAMLPILPSQMLNRYARSGRMVSQSAPAGQSTEAVAALPSVIQEFKRPGTGTSRSVLLSKSKGI